jgi:glutamyl-tRNA reductase
MSLLLTGLNHKSAPLEVREQFAVSEAELPSVVQCLAQYPGVAEAFVLSTCNRVEFLARTTDETCGLTGFLAAHFQRPAEEFSRYLYEFRDQEAVRHLFEVASSLDSLVVGEPQILGQVKEAYAIARAVGAVDSHLDALLTRAFAVAKRVRSETSVGSSAVSVASVAVDLAKKIFGALAGHTVCLVGAGKMSELAARHLLAHGAGTLLVANRTAERAFHLAQKFHARVVPFAELYDSVDKADIVISSTGSPGFIFRKEHAEHFLHRRRNRPMFFIDIAVPRDVDPAVNELDGIFVYDIDDLQSVVDSNLADRGGEARRAALLIGEEVERFMARLQTAEVVPTIVSLQEHLETIRQAEIDRVRGRLGRLSPEQEMAIETLSRGIINKIMHTPIMTLKSAAREGQETTTVVDIVRRLFNLHGKTASASAGSEPDQSGAPD